MSVTWWSLVRFAHVLAAMVWVGGQLVLSGVVLPVLRAELEPGVRAMVVPRAARRFGALANIALLPLLFITGSALAWHRGVTFGSFDQPGYGRLFAIKLALVVAAVVLAAAHGLLASRRPGSARGLAITAPREPRERVTVANMAGSSSSALDSDQVESMSGEGADRGEGHDGEDDSDHEKRRFQLWMRRSLANVGSGCCHPGLLVSVRL
ncbi:MAG: hypothetical protein QOI86_3506 [Actinomycetota bacterium]|jgi:uncharacterized membrane protein|nr:hypothetical protein [Actinomycetota bacterium]